MEYYAGLDVSLRSIAVCVIDGDGRTIRENSLPFEIDEIVAYLRSLPIPIIRVGFKAGAMSQHLFFGLKLAGFDAVCMEAGR